MKRGIRKVLTFVKLSITSKIFGKIILKAPTKRLKLPYDRKDPGYKFYSTA